MYLLARASNWDTESCKQIIQCIQFAQIVVHCSQYYVCAFVEGYKYVMVD